MERSAVAGMRRGSGARAAGLGAELAAPVREVEWAFANLSVLVSRVAAMRGQGLLYRPVRPKRRGPVPVYRSGLAGNRSEPVEVKFEFKNLSSTVLYRYTGRFGRYTGDLKKFSDG